MTRAERALQVRLLRDRARDLEKQWDPPTSREVLSILLDFLVVMTEEDDDAG